MLYLLINIRYYLAVIDKRIEDIVDANYVTASVLYHFGIEFYLYSTETLAQACESKGLNVDMVIKELENGPICLDNNLKLNAFPIDLVIEYLKHTHFLFIKRKLPYIAQLIQHLPSHQRFEDIARDLKVVFPLFVEDFIQHIYKEEDTLFSYIRLLNKVKVGSTAYSKVYNQMESQTLNNYAIDHEEHNDEMEGIRTITKDYNCSSQDPLHVRVIYAELQLLEQELLTHADVENRVLFPKALLLEQEVKNIIKKKIALN